MTVIDSSFWQSKYDSNQTGWDRGAVSPQLITLCNEQLLKPCRIAVPGCGSGWELIELAGRGFDVVGIDYTQAAIERSQALLKKHHLVAELILADVLKFDISKKFDAVYEQTCLCAIHPDSWVKYAKQLHTWLKPGGSLFLMAMQIPRKLAVEEGVIEGPPYHCDINAIRALFSSTYWLWPKPPYVKVPHPNHMHELAIELKRR